MEEEVKAVVTQAGTYKPNRTGYITGNKNSLELLAAAERDSPSEEKDSVNLLKPTLASCNINVKSCSGTVLTIQRAVDLSH